MVRIIITAAALLAALPAAAQSGDGKARLIGAIAAAGCTVTPDNNASVLASANLTEDEAAVIVGEMIAAGEAEPVNDTLVLKTGGCN